MKKLQLSHSLRLIGLSFGLTILTACSTSDFFLGKDNRPPPKELPIITQSAGTSILWQKKLGKGGGDAGLKLVPAVAGNTIYAVSADGRFYALDSQTGAEQFSLKLDNDIAAGVSVADGVVYIGTRGGDIVALDAKDGHILWRDQLSSIMLSPPATDNGLIIARTIDGAINAYSKDGTALWRYHLNSPILSVRGTASPIIGGGVVIITSDNGFFIVLDQATGLPIAELRIASGSGNNPVSRLVDMDATPQINNKILFGSAYQSMMFALNLADGSPVWQQSEVFTQQDFSLSPDKVFLTTDIDHIVALNQQDGSIAWKNNQLEGRYVSPPVAIPGRVGVIDGEGYLHWLDAQTGDLIGRISVGKVLANSRAVVMHDRIIWQLNDGHLVAIQPN